MANSSHAVPKATWSARSPKAVGWRASRSGAALMAVGLIFTVGEQATLNALVVKRMAACPCPEGLIRLVSGIALRLVQGGLGVSLVLVCLGRFKGLAFDELRVLNPPHPKPTLTTPTNPTPALNYSFFLTSNIYPNPRARTLPKPIQQPQPHPKANSNKIQC